MSRVALCQLLVALLATTVAGQSYQISDPVFIHQISDPVFVGDTPTGDATGAQPVDPNPNAAACRELSWSVRAVNEVLATIDASSLAGTQSIFESAISAADVTAAIKSLYNTFKSNMNGYSNALYVGTSTGNFYGIKNCWTRESSTDSFCQIAGAATRFLGYIRNEAVFGDARRRVFRINAAGDISALALGVEPNPFDTVNTNWYRMTGRGWSDLYFYKSGDVGQTIAQSPKTVPTLKVASDRTVRETCTDGCLSNSYVTSVTQAVQARGAEFSGAATQASVAANIFSLWTIFTANEVENGYTVALHVGFTGTPAQSYTMVNCHSPAAAEFYFCKVAGVATKYIALVLATNLPSGSKRYAYRVTEFGAQAGLLGEEALPYELVKRRWFVQGSMSSNWSEETVTIGGLPGRIYALPIGTNGVAAAERWNAEPCFAPCLEHSYARRASQELAAEGAAFENRATTLEGVGALVKLVATAFKRNDYGHNVALFYGSSAGDFYGVVNCWGNEARDNVYCKLSDTKYIAYVKNNIVFGNNQRRIFAVSAAANFGSQIGQESFSFDTVNSAWYMTGYGWGNPTPLASGSITQTYGVTVYNALGAKIGVAAADRVNSEPCYDACRRNSYAVASTQAVAAMPLVNAFEAPFVGTRTLDAHFAYVMDTFLANDFGQNLFLYLGFANGDFYGVKNCWSRQGSSDQFCKQAGTQTQFVAYVRNEFELSSRKRHVYKVTDSKKLGMLLGVETEDYETVLRPWFLQKYGWTPEYTFLSGGTGATHVDTRYVEAGGEMALQAVVAADRSSNEACYSSCLTNSYALWSAQSLAGGSLDFAYNASTWDGIDATVRALKAVMTKTDRGQNIDLRLGTVTNNYYAITDCFTSANAKDEVCYAAGTTTRYVARVRNDNYFGDAKVHAFTVTDAGSLGQSLGVTTADFPVASQAWYTQGHGWSQVFDLALGGRGQTYSVSVSRIDGAPLGVVSSTRISTEPCNDQCQANSFAVPAAHALSMAGLAKLQDADLEVAALAIKTIFNVFKENDRGANVMLFFGFNNGDFYAVKNCRIRESLVDPFCGMAIRQGVEHVAYIRNAVAFGDLDRRVFLLDTTGAFVSEVPAGNAGGFDTVTRAWFQQQFGWTVAYDFASGGTGTTYAVPILDNQLRSIGVVAADATAREACYNPCLANSWAAPAVRELANVPESRLDFYVDATSMLKVRAAVKKVWIAYNNHVRGNNVMLAFGLANGDYYGLKNCRTLEAVTDVFCQDPSTTSRLLAYVRNENLFGTKQRFVFQVSEDGELGKQVGVTPEEFDTLNRPWYQLGLTTFGWTEAYTFASGGRGISYATPLYLSYGIQVGVVMADKTFNEGCSDACLQASWASPAAHSLAVRNLESYTNVNSATQLNRLFGEMYAAFKETDNGMNVELRVGFATSGDYYSLQSCWVPSSVANPYCQAAGGDQWLIGYVRSFTLYNNTKLSVFRADPAGLGEKLGTTADFNTLGQPFFTQASGWGSLYDTAGDMTGRTYSVPVTTAGGTRIAVVAAERMSGERCASCSDLEVPSVRVCVRTLETIYDIAPRYGYTWPELLLLNPQIGNPDHLVPNEYVYNGMIVVVQENESLYELATKYGTGWWSVVSYNPQIPFVKPSLDWVEIMMSSGFPYYYNKRTQETSFEKPEVLRLAEATDLRIFVGQKVAVRPRAEMLICQGTYYH